MNLFASLFKTHTYCMQYGIKNSTYVLKELISCLLHVRLDCS